MFFENLVDLKNDKKNLKLFLKPTKNIIQCFMVVIDSLIFIDSHQVVC